MIAFSPHGGLLFGGGFFIDRGLWPTDVEWVVFGMCTSLAVAFFVLFFFFYCSLSSRSGRGAYWGNTENLPPFL